MLSAKLIRERFDYNPETGEFFWKVTRNSNAKAGTKTGTIRADKKYYVLCVDNKLYLAHRIAWLHHYGKWPKKHLDHIDGNGLNNAISNLRECNDSQNHANKNKYKNNTSGYKGVGWHKRKSKWFASLRFERKCHFLGYFETKEAAHKAYKSAADKIFGDFARYE